MDKHERKRLARWEAKTGKEQCKLNEFLRQHSYGQVWRRIERTVREWEPEYNTLFAKAVKIIAKPRVSALVMYNLDRTDDEIAELLMSRRTIESRRVRLYLTDEEIANELATEMSWKEQTRLFQLAFTLRRHQLRANTIRAELLVKTTRLRAIQNCKSIKEELMMNVWHPRRVEHILTTYGWEAYENLLGM